MILCGIKNENGEACVLEQWHNPQDGWKHRKHQTAAGVTFTFMGAREKARPYRGSFPTESSRCR